jgi:nicotinate-nucleotide adenylyltransferase
MWIQCAGWLAERRPRPSPTTCCPCSRPILLVVRRGILGGTFDPPHLAHLVAGEAAYRELGIDLVSFLPTGRPWQKAGLEVSPAVHRWEMTRRAVTGIPYFEADDREVTRDGWTYTADTLETFPRREELVLILGSDAAAGLPTWQRSEAVLARVQLAVMTRPGVERSSVEAAVGAVHWLDAPQLAISGTLLRARRRAGQSLRFLVPDPVLEYIEATDLYADR